VNNYKLNDIRTSITSLYKRAVKTRRGKGELEENNSKYDFDPYTMFHMPNLSLNY
jgi:hypothetical protein